jgi:hypothetical protein
MGMVARSACQKFWATTGPITKRSCTVCFSNCGISPVSPSFLAPWECVRSEVEAVIADVFSLALVQDCTKMRRTKLLKDRDRSFFCIVTRSSTILSLEERFMSNQASLSLVPAAFSIKMYSDPTEFCASPLQANTLGVGMLTTVRTCSHDYISSRTQD